MRYASFIDQIASDATKGWGVLDAAFGDQEQGADVIILAIGDPDFPTPPRIVDEAVTALRSGDTHYSEIQGRHQLRTTIAERFTKQTGVSWSKDNVMVFAGTQNALFAASLCLLEPGTEVIALDPSYLTYEATLRASGASLVTVPLDPETGFRIDVERIAAAVTHRTRAIVINSPNNPTGALASQAELHDLAALAIDRDLWVVADEVYSEIVFAGRHRSIAAAPGMQERTVTVSSLSKSHAMTGWRIGWAIAPAPLTAHFAKLGMVMAYGVPGFIQEAAITALTAGDDAMTEMVDTYRRRRDLAAAIFAHHDVPVLVPEAGMYLLVDVRQVPLDPSELVWDLYRKTGVAVVDAGAFGANAQGWLRVAFTNSDARIEEGCRRIAQYVTTSITN